MKKRILCVVLACFMLISCMPSFAFATDFTGYTAISTPEQFEAIKDNLSGRYYLTNDIDMSGRAYWQCVGDEGTPFQGIFDGNGFAVKNLRMNISYATYNEIYAGLFGYLGSNARVRNLTLANCNMKAQNDKVSSSSSSLHLGAVAGYSKGRIENCHVSGTVTGNEQVGGLVGYNNSVVINCTNSATINAEDYAGGVVGYNAKTVTGCANFGEIISLGTVGGVVDKNDGGTVSGCFNTGTLHGKSHSGGVVAMIVNTGTLEKSYNNGDIINTNGWAGGVAGYVKNSSYTKNKCKISDCYNEGYIFGNNYTDDCGGIVAYVCNAIVTNCYNVGNIAITHQRNNTNIDGIAGNSSSNTFTNCFSTLETSIGTNCSVAQLKSQSFYSGFDFNTVWKMSDDVKYPLAVLQNTEHIRRLSGVGDFAGGNGSSYDPFEITQKEHLNNIRNYLGSYFILKNDIVFEEADFAEGGAFYNEGAGFLPIGDKTASFGGTLDGNGHKISGLYINTESTYAGFIGYSVGSVQNLHLENVRIVNSKTGEANYTGGIAAYLASDASIVNCSVSGSVCSKYAYVGGITGEVVSAKVVLQGNKNYASVTANNSYVGGIAGHSYATITNCQNYGEISGNDYTGGIVGYACYTQITGCSNSGAVSGQEKVGGIVGETYYAQITGCANSGTVVGEQKVGGIVGAPSYEGVFDCFNAGMLYAKQYLGGIAGHINFTNINRCYNVGILNGSTYYNGIGVELNSAKFIDCFTLKRNETSTAQDEYSLAQMKRAQTYTNFDFDTVWEMSESESYPFPVLRALAFDEPGENFSDFGGGRGTAYSPYVIKNQQHFDNIRNYPKSYFVIAQDIDFSGAFTPISDFYGNIDGRGFSLKNITITASQKLTGIFTANYGNIKNINVKDATVSASTTVVSARTGIIAGENQNTISNCSVSGTVTATGLYMYAAGIAGYNAGEVKNCVNYAEIESPWNCGGIVSANDKIVSSCINLGKIRGGTRGMAAGIVSYNSSNGVATDCYNTSEIYSEEESAGVTAINYGTLRNCYNIGNVRSSITKTGGICVSNSATIENCYHINANATSVYGTLCTLSQMTDAATFTGFDFESVWTMEGDALYPYPELRNVSFENTLIGIDVTTPPTKQDYQCAVDSLDLTGAKLTLIYDVCKIQIDITEEMVSGFSNESVGSCKINVTYNGFSDYFYVTIICSHNYVTDYNSAAHWAICSYCKGGKPMQEHVFDNDCDTECNENCGYVRDVTHDYKTSYNEAEHFSKCSVCKKEIEFAPHVFENRCDINCDCGYERSITHDYKPTFDTENHFDKCTVCDDVVNEKPHVFENGCDTTCDCGYERTITHDYKFGYDAEGHFEKCTVCGDVINETPHNFDESRYIRSDNGHWHPCLQTGCEEKGKYAEHTESEIIVDQGATCVSEGEGHTECTVCMMPIKSKVELPLEEHTKGQWKTVREATTTKTGLQEQRCTKCNTLLAEKSIPKKVRKNPFTDVKKSDYFYDAVLWAVENGITAGATKTTFEPHSPCTRGQIATFLWRAAGCPKPATSKNPFADVKASDYYYKAVLWAVGKGITSGTSKTTFEPNAPCTRGQIAAFLWRANGSTKPKTSKNPFTDVKKSDFYYKAVLWAVENGITSGTTKTTFGPSEPCTRGQIATFLYRAYN